MKRLLWRYCTADLKPIETTAREISNFLWKSEGVVYPETWNVLTFVKKDMSVNDPRHFGAGVPVERTTFNNDGLYANLYSPNRNVQALPVIPAKLRSLELSVLVLEAEHSLLLPDAKNEMFQLFGSVRFPMCNVIYQCSNPHEAVEYIRENSFCGIIHESHCKCFGVKNKWIMQPRFWNDCTCYDKEKEQGHIAKNIRGVSKDARTPFIVSLKDKYLTLESELETVLI